MKTVMAIDIGGTKISHCLVNEKGEKLSEIKKVSTPKTAVEIFNYLKSECEKYADKIDAVGIATAGAVNNENTKIVSSTMNLPVGYPELDFAKLSDKPVFIENDANAAAWAEFRLGKAKDFNHSIILTIGTGIGGGIIINRQLLKGSSGLAGEVGTIKISYDKRRKCTCGNYDCWESYGSGTGLKKTAEEIAENDVIFKTSIWKDKQPKAVTTYDIIEGVKKGDEYSKKVFDMWQYHVYCGTFALTNIFNPEIIVFSGGLCEVIEVKKIEKMINETSVVTDVKIEISDMKNDIGMLGVGILAAEKLK